MQSPMKVGKVGEQTKHKQTKHLLISTCCTFVVIVRQNGYVARTFRTDNKKKVELSSKHVFPVAEQQQIDREDYHAFIAFPTLSRKSSLLWLSTHHKYL